MHRIPDYIIDALRDSQDSRVKEYVSEVEWQKKGREIQPFKDPPDPQIACAPRWVEASVKWPGYTISCGFPSLAIAERWAETVQRPSLGQEQARAAFCKQYGSE